MEYLVHSPQLVRHHVLLNATYWLDRTRAHATLIKRKNNWDHFISFSSLILYQSLEKKILREILFCYTMLQCINLYYLLNILMFRMLRASNLARRFADTIYKTQHWGSTQIVTYNGRDILMIVIYWRDVSNPPWQFANLVPFNSWFCGWSVWSRIGCLLRRGSFESLAVNVAKK